MAKKNPKITWFDALKNIKNSFVELSAVKYLIDLTSEALSNHHSRIETLERGTKEISEYLYKNEDWRRKRMRQDMVHDAIIESIIAGEEEKAKKITRAATKKTTKKVSKRKSR